MEKHNFNPIYDEQSKILILGSFPSVKSRQARFFYGHPQNRFWRVISGIFNTDCPVTIPEKTKLILDNHIALWDVIAECEITGSSDSSIKNVKVNDFSKILSAADIKAVFCNGGTSFALYKKYCESTVGITAQKLPSTSPANAAFSLERLIREWRVISAYL